MRGNGGIDHEKNKRGYRHSGPENLLSGKREDQNKKPVQKEHGGTCPGLDELRIVLEVHRVRCEVTLIDLIYKVSK